MAGKLDRSKGGMMDTCDVCGEIKPLHYCLECACKHRDEAYRKGMLRAAEIVMQYDGAINSESNSDASATEIVEAIRKEARGE